MDFSGLLRTGALMAAAASLVACAGGPRYSPYADNGASRPPAKPPATAKRGGTWKPYQINGKWYVPREQPDYDETGVASWYGGHHQGKPTSNGERFDKNAITAAHKTLPLPSIVEVTNLDNGKRIKVRVNDRGPFVDGRIIDLSQEAAKRLGFEGKGLARVRVRYVGEAGIRTATIQVNID
ncbi:septal ring lytic transglycosylase RlpA family protein [Phenylobacterium sp. J367]|uniref:septal ring lytic transglycosylase RlpA family protein n=1 Tax=Phenylobacterium sp. J367 TaxID=2898435 RepID=UPI002151A88F|nr:septal ring lytic transglycosylase RlpA family protein [Phenylobacterium sp. J367]